jgi:uncharacterized OsmC-like protein
MTKLQHLEGYQFKVKFDAEKIPGFVVDETKPIGQDGGPTPRRLLSAAIGHCLSSSLLYCLSKARIGADSLETTVTLSTARNEEGRLGVKETDVQIALEVDEDESATS